MLLIVELAILGLFLIDFAIHAISYGLLFLKHVSPVLEALLILANVAVSILMAIEQTESGIDRNSIFGIKILFGMSLLYLRLNTLRA